MNWYSALVFLPFLLIGLASAGTTWYAWLRQGKVHIYAMPLITLGIVAWLAGDALALLVNQPRLYSLSNWLTSLGKDLLPVASLAMALQITGLRSPFSRHVWAMLGASLLAGQILFWASTSLAESRIDWLVIILRLGLLVGAAFLLTRNLPHRPATLRKWASLLLAGTFAVWAIYTIEIIWWKPSPYPDLSPLLFTVGQIILVSSGLRPRLYDVLLLAREALIEIMGDAVLVLDPAEHIVDLNPAAQQIISSQKGKERQATPLGQSVDLALPGLGDLVMPGTAALSPVEFALGQAGERRFFEVRTTSLRNSLGDLAGHLVQMQETTDRRLAEAARQALADQLAQHLRRLDALLSTTPDYFLLHDQQGHFLYTSPTALKALELSIEQISDKTWRELGLPATAGKIFDQHLAKVFDTGLAETFELEIPSAQGKRRFELILSPFCDPEGQIEMVVTTARDISEQHKIKNALRASEERYRTVVDNLEEGIVIHDAIGRVVACNPSAERILGLSVDRSLDKILVDTSRLAVYEDGSPFPNERHPAMLALNTGEAQSNVVVGIQSPSKEITWMRVSAQPLFKPGEDRPYGVVSSYADITHDKLAERALRDSQNKLESLLEFAPVAIILVDAKGIMHSVNKKTEETFGYARKELIGQPIEMLIPEAYKTSHIQLRQRYMAAPQARPMGKDLKLYALRKDGSSFPVDIGLNTIDTAEEKLVMSYLVDITERNRQAEALHQANEQLTQSMTKLEDHNRELTLFNEMGDMLQSCATLEEAHAVVIEFARQLFPEHCGALYQLNPLRNLVEVVATWGEQPPEEVEFGPQACWALRRGRPHSVLHSGDSLSCSHVHASDQSAPPAYICVPMLAQGEVKGVFHLRSMSIDAHRNHEQLAVTVAEHISMSLSNLALRETLRLLSVRDPLTGLYNRRYLEEALSRELHLAQRYNRQVGVVMFDLDHFKDVNDNFGHAAGDAMLRTVANFLNRSLRTEDIACRYGGEEFVVILPDTPLENSVRVAEKLWNGLRFLHTEYLGQSLTGITASFGVAAFSGDGQSARSLLDNADKALYQAKQEGRDCIRVAGQALGG